jgi:putative phosphoesterase
MLALLYDFHGNLPALQAVVEDARHEGVDRYVLGGDYALFGPYPSETIALLRDLPNATWIRGNVDRWSAHPDQAPDELVVEAIDACRAALGAELVEELDALPEQVVLAVTRYCHGSPLSDVRSFMPDESDEDVELLAGVDEQRVVFGHTHLQFRRTRTDGVELINPGSVGMPMDGDPRAAYAIEHDDGTIELRRVAYDHEMSAEAMQERFEDAPWVSRSVARLRTARP